jgi:SAM-dependent methyltransferase
MLPIKQVIKSLLPSPILQRLRKYKAQRENNKLQRIYTEYKNLTPQQVFTKIYEEGAWGESKDESHRFFSGSGSHDNITTKTYLEAIQKFLSAFERKPDVVDLGCGDFSIGSQIRSLCGVYTACDIVRPLIGANKEKYRSLDVDFRVLDLTQDELPKADIVFIRQVLQHLPNEQIKQALPQISSKYKYLILTEHLPSTNDFIANIDKPSGPTTRLRNNSGLVLTSPPFNLTPKEQRVLCQVSGDGTVIRTTLYVLS